MLYIKTDTPLKDKKPDRVVIGKYGAIKYVYSYTATEYEKKLLEG